MFATCWVERVYNSETVGDGRAQIINGVAGAFRFGTEPTHLQDAWIRDLRCLFRQLDLVLPRTAWIAQGGEFVNTAQCGVIVGSNKPRPHAPDSDGSALLL